MNRTPDRGFTVIELAITLALSMLVMASILGLLASQSRAEKRVSSFADNQEVLRQAVVAMQRDIRSSEPLRPPAERVGGSLVFLPADAYQLRIDLNLYDTIDAVTPTPIRWRVDTSTDELLRERVDANGNVVEVSHRVAGVVNDAQRPLFAFFPPGGSAYRLVVDPVTGEIANPRDIAQCTIRIHIILIGAPNRGPEPATLASDAQLRNRLPGGQGCDDISGEAL